MKILIICNYSSGLYKFRGMLIQELVKQGHTVRAIVPKLDDKNEIKEENNLKRLHCGLKRIPMERRGMNPVHDAKLMFAYYKTVKKMKPDLVLTYTIKPNIYGGFVCRLLKVPYAVNITGLGTAFQGNGLLRHLVTAMYKVALKKAKVVFFENAENRDVIVEARIIPKEKTHVLAGAGVDLEHFKYAPYPKDSEITRFLFVGRVMQEKGIDELFQAMQRLNKGGYKCVLDVLGGFEENYFEKIVKENVYKKKEREKKKLNIDAYEILKYSLEDINKMDADQLDEVNKKVYNYFDINENAINKDYLLDKAVFDFNNPKPSFSTGNGYVDILLILSIVVTLGLVIFLLTIFVF